MSNKVEQLELSFMLNAKSVEQAGTALRSEIEKGIGAVSFDALRRNAASTTKKIGDDLKKALTQEISIDTKQLDKSLSRYQAQRLKIERQIAAEVGKGGKGRVKGEADVGNLRMRELRKLIKAERRLFKERTRSMNEMNRGARQYLSTMKKAAKYGGGGGGIGGGGFVQNMMGGGGRSRGVKGPKIAGGKKGGGFMGKMMGGVGRAGAGAMAKAGPMMAKGAAAMGTAAAALGAAAVAIGAVVGVIAGLLAVIVAADSKMKDFNKSLLSTVGGADLMTGAADGATQSIENLRNAAIGAQFRLKSLAKDNIEILKTLHEHGSTVREMAKDTADATTAMQGYTQAMQMVLTYSRMIGESASTVAQNMATSGEELGLTLEGVSKRFSSITKMAMESGFSTKRFFSMVIQATSGMSMYNVRLEEASGLLVRIGKILGQKTGGEFLQSLSKGFVNESMQQRMKRVMLTGKGNTKEAMTHSAKSTAEDFQNKLVDGDLKVKFSDLGIEGQGDKKLTDVGADELRKILSKLDPKQAAMVTAKMNEKAIAEGKDGIADGLRQKLQTLISISQGSKGGLQNMAKNLDALDMGGKLNMLRNSMKTMFPGKEIYELSALQLAALESATGMQGEQLQQMRELTQGMDGNFKVLQQTAKEGYKKGISKEDLEKQQKAQIKAYGAYVNTSGEIVAATISEGGHILDTEERDENGKMVVKKIKDLTEYYQSQGGRLDRQMEAENFNEDRYIAEEIAANTWSIADMLSAGITQILNMIYGVVRGILNAVGNGDYNSALKTQKQAHDQARRKSGEQRTLDKEIRELKKALAGEKDETKAKSLEGQIRAKTIKSELLGMEIDDARKVADSVFAADGSVDKKAIQVQERAGWVSRLFGGNSTQTAVFDPLSGGLDLGVSTAQVNKTLSNKEAAEDFKKRAPTAYAAMVAQQNADLATTDEQFAKGQRVAQDHASNVVDAVGAPSSQVILDTSSTSNTMGTSKNVPVPMNAGDMTRGDVFTRKSVDLSGAPNASTTGINTASPLTMHNAFNPEMGHGWAGAGHGAGWVYPQFNMDGDGNVWTYEMEDGKRDYNEYGGAEESNRVSGWGRWIDPYTHGGTWDNAGVKSDLTSTTGITDFELKPTQVDKHMAPAHTFAASWRADQSYAHKATARVVDPQTAQHYRSGADVVANMNFLEGMGFDMDKGMDKATITRAPEVNHDGTYTDPVGKKVKSWDETEATDPAAMARQISRTPTKDDAGKNRGAVSLRPADEGQNVMKWYGEMKTQAKRNAAIGGKAGQIGEKDDGSAYTLADLHEHMKAASEELGNQMTLKQFQDWMAKNQSGPWKSIKENQKANNKALIALNRMKQIMEDEKKDPDAKKKEIAGQLSSYLGFGNSMTSRLARGGTPASGSNQFNKLKAAAANDAFVQKALGELGISNPALQDFIYQGGSRGGVITPIHGQDSFIGMRPRGPVDNAMGSAGGQATINVHVYEGVSMEKVKQAIYTAARTVGVGGRVQNRSGHGNFGKAKTK